jgi:hypothetical protein
MPHVDECARDDVDGIDRHAHTADTQTAPAVSLAHEIDLRTAADLCVRSDSACVSSIAWRAYAEELA